MTGITPLRVLMIVHSQFERDARVRRYAETLAEHGHEVDVVALTDPAATSAQEITGLNVISVPIRRKRSGALRYILEWLGFALLAAWKTMWLSRTRRYDVAHVHNMPNYLVFAALPAKLRGAKVILDIHDLVPEVFGSKFRITPRHPVMRALRLEEKTSCRFADTVIFASELFRDIALQRESCSADKSVVVLNTPDPTIFDAERFPWSGPEGPEEFRVLYVGTVAPRYGLDNAVRAVKLLQPELPGLRFLIYPRLDGGEGESLTQLRDLVHELDLESVVDFRRPVPLNEMPMVMSRANVGLYTPRVDMHMDIALSIKVPELVAMSVPVVTTRTRVMDRYFSPDQVAYFDDGDVEGCADAIRRLYEHPCEAREIAHKALRFFDLHRWEIERERYLGLLSELAGRSH